MRSSARFWECHTAPRRNGMLRIFFSERHTLKSGLGSVSISLVESNVPQRCASSEQYLFHDSRNSVAQTMFSSAKRMKHTSSRRCKASEQRHDATWVLLGWRRTRRRLRFCACRREVLIAITYSATQTSHATAGDAAPKVYLAKKRQRGKT